MRALGAALRDGIASGRGAAAVQDLDASALEANALSLLERARAAWPDVSVDPLRFLTHAGERLDGRDDPFVALGALHAADLYLACACLDGHERALAHFEAVYLAQVPVHVARYVAAPARVDELKQSLRVRLLVAGERPPQLAGYRGRGPLGAWLRVVAVRAAIDLVRESPPAASATTGLVTPVADAELALLKARYAPLFQRAFEAALTGLAPRERTMLRLHFADGMSLSAIARAFHVHASTVQRAIARIRDQVLDATLGGLGEELGVDPAQAESIVRLVQSRIDIDLRACLATGRQSS